MKKKLFFKLFIFAVIGTFVTFTSCKDYDDDIDRIDADLTALKNSALEQSDLTALQTQLTASISAVQAELNTAKTNLATLQANAATKAEVDAAKADVLDQAVKLETYNTYKAWVDGEIATLKTDLAKAATKEEVGALETLLNSEIASVREELSLTVANLEALTEIVEGNSAAIADVETALAEQLAEIEANATEIAAVKADLQLKYDELTAEIDALNVEIADINTDLTAFNEALEAAVTRLDGIDTEIETIKTRIDALEASIGADLLSVSLNMNSMITEISFDFVYDDYERYRNLNYSTTTEVVDFVFAPEINNAITFVEGQRLASQAQKIIVKVSPANADLSKMLDKIYLIRGDNNTEINDYLKAVKAERANPLLTAPSALSALSATRAMPSETGLWYVSFELSQTADLEELTALTYGEGVYLDEGVEYDHKGNYLFAMAIENTVDAAEDAEDRFVISDFVISIETIEDFTRAGKLDFSVGDTDVAAINNRADDNSSSLNEDGITYKELVWTDNNAQPEITSTNTEEGDNRSDKSAYPAVQGEPMKITITEGEESIRAMYVTLDYEENAIESAPSEWNAWNSYSYTGLNTVVEDTETEITIDSDQAINDIIGFRVFAVNYDGTLVDPDGKAFYVSLGVEGTDWGTVNTVITPESETVTGTESAQVAKSLTALTGADTFEWTTDEDENEGEPAFHAYFVDADGTAIFNTNSSDATVSFEDVAKIYTVPTATTWLAYEDNKVYNGTLIIKNTTGHVLATLKVTFKKVLPTDAPSGFSVKTNQLGSDGIYKSYLIPMQDGVVNWTAPLATHGSMPLDQVFNFEDDALASVDNFDVIFADALRSGSDIGDLTVNPGDADLVVAKEFIDNTTQHETSVVYNYGNISTELATGVDYVIEVENFPTIFSNIYNSTYSWSWDPEFDTDIVYGTPVTINLSNILGKSTRDNIYNAPLSEPYGAEFGEPSLSLNGLDGAVGSAKLYTNGTTREEYFNATFNTTTGTITLTEASASSNPTADVASTLVITVYDMYGHEVVIELPMTVLTRND